MRNAPFVSLRGTAAGLTRPRCWYFIYSVNQSQSDPVVFLALLVFLAEWKAEENAKTRKQQRNSGKRVRAIWNATPANVRLRPKTITLPPKSLLGYPRLVMAPAEPWPQ